MRTQLGYILVISGCSRHYLIDQANDEQIENLPTIACRDYGLNETQRGAWNEGLEFMRAWAHEALAEYLRQRTCGE